MQNILNNEIKKTSNILRALNHPLRQRILSDIYNSNNKLSVTGVQIKLRPIAGMVQSVVSQHLAILRTANLVETERLGKNIYYSVNHAEIDRVNALCKQINNSSKN